MDTSKLNKTIDYASSDEFRKEFNKTDKDF